MPSSRPRRGISVDQPQGGFAYPFVEYSHALPEVVGDLVFAYRDAANQFTHPLFIAWMHGFGTAAAETPTGNSINWEGLPTPTMLSLFGTETPTFSHARDLAIYSRNGRKVFSSLDADVTYSVRPWGDWANIHEWRGTQAVLRLVEYTCQGPDDPEVNLPSLCFPTASWLDERAVIQHTPDVRSLRVPPTVVQGIPVILRGGYNVVFSPTIRVEGQRRRTVIEVSAEAGSGDGYALAPPSEADQPILTINKQAPDAAGNFRLDGEGVLRIERPVLAKLQDDPPEMRLQDSALSIANDGAPCCTCQDFINTYEGIRRLRNRYADLSVRAQGVRDTFIRNVQRFERERALRQSQKLQVRLSPLCPDFLDIAVSYVNQLETCLHNVFLVLSFTHTEGGKEYKTTPEGVVTGEIIYGSTFRSGNDAAPACGMPERYTLGGNWPHYWAYFPRVDSGSVASITSRFYFENAEPFWNIVVVADAYAVPRIGPIPPGGSPIPDHTFGIGPTGPAGYAARLVPGVVHRSTGLLTGADIKDCFDAESEIG